MSLSNQKEIVRDPNFEKLDQACHVWFLQQRSKGAPVSGPVLKEKALQLSALLYPDLNVDSFKASSGWLHKFCLRHGIKSKSLHKEPLSADPSCIGDFQSKLHSKKESEGYTLNQYYNADETGLWWRLMPSKSLVHGGEKRAANFKKAKERITLLGCANATGTWQHVAFFNFVRVEVSFPRFIAESTCAGIDHNGDLVEIGRSI